MKCSKSGFYHWNVEWRLGSIKVCLQLTTIWCVRMCQDMLRMLKLCSCCLTIISFAASASGDNQDANISIVQAIQIFIVAWKTLGAAVIVTCLHKAVTLPQDDCKSEIESDSDVSVAKHWAEFMKKLYNIEELTGDKISFNVDGKKQGILWWRETRGW